MHLADTLVGARILLGLVFLVAVTSKLLAGLHSFRKALTDFGVPQSVAGPLSITLPFAELAAAMLLFYARSAWIGALIALTLLLIFNVAVAVNLLAGKRPNCNCFGQLHSAPIAWTTFARNSALAAVAAGLLCWLPRDGGATLGQVLGSFTAGQLALFLGSAIQMLGLLALGLSTLYLFRQNGRLLLRIEALESRVLSRNPPAAAHPAPPWNGLPLGSKAIPFELPSLVGGRTTLDDLLRNNKPLLLITTDPKCGPCNSLLPDIASWQKNLASEINIVLISHGRYADNRSKAAEYNLQNVLVAKNHAVAEKYHAVGTPTAVLIRGDGTIGSSAVGGADRIRELVSNKVWTDAGFAVFMKGISHAAASTSRKPGLPIGSVPPDFRLPTLDGYQFELTSYRSGKTVLLFWNPGCGFCQRMIGSLREWEQQKPAGAPHLILVSTGSTEANRKMGLGSTVLMDESFSIGQSYGASGTPSAVLIDEEGKIASAVTVGAIGVMQLLQASQLETAPPEAAAVAAG